jgi:tetratricopeptide (TPR) repeat protein
VWRGKGDIDRAIADFSDAIRLDPKSADNLYQRGFTLENNKHDVDRALADYDAAIRLDPKFLPPFNNRGLLCERRGSLDRAPADFQAVLAADPKSASAAERIKRVEQKLAMLAQPATAPKTVPAPKTPPAPATAAPETRVALVIGGHSLFPSHRLPGIFDTATARCTLQCPRRDGRSSSLAGPRRRNRRRTASARASDTSPRT